MISFLIVEVDHIFKELFALDRHFFLAQRPIFEINQKFDGQIVFSERF